MHVVLAFTDGESEAKHQDLVSKREACPEKAYCLVAASRPDASFTWKCRPVTLYLDVMADLAPI